MLLCDAHPGYITWERFEQNERQLRDNDNARARGAARRPPPREGSALLQGLAICSGVRSEHGGALLQAKGWSASLLPVQP